MFLPLTSHQLKMKFNLLFNKPHFPLALFWMRITLVLWAAGLFVALWLLPCSGSLDVHWTLLFPFSSLMHFCSNYLKNKVSWFNFFADLRSRLNCKLSSWPPVTKVRRFWATWIFISGCIISREVIDISFKICFCSHLKLLKMHFPCVRWSQLMVKKVFIFCGKYKLKADFLQGTDTSWSNNKSAFKAFPSPSP